MLKKVVLVNTTTRKKDKIGTLLTKINTIEIRSQNDLISITNILSLHDRGVRFNRQNWVQRRYR